MFHFDFPQAYQDKYNGWLGTDMVDNFEKYADFLFSEYGKKVTEVLRGSVGLSEN